VFGVGLPALRSALGTGRGLEWAIIESFLTLMAHTPDTLIARKLGPDVALESSRRAAAVLDAGPAPEALAALDAWLRPAGPPRSPGARAALVSAALFAALRDGTIRLPLAGGPAGWAGSLGDGPL